MTLTGKTALRADVRSRADMQNVSQRIADELAGLDIFFANARVAFSQL
ncbi:hypothetical protein bAD24_III09390 [Burkholderia sp. AD24]|nr:hypothetical protein bAD24_III09390 [Burkholderia sp. AD24]